MYILSNSTLDSNSFNDIAKILNEDLEKGDLKKLSLENLLFEWIF